MFQEKIIKAIYRGYKAHQTSKQTTTKFPGKLSPKQIASSGTELFEDGIELFRLEKFEGGFLTMT